MRHSRPHPGRPRLWENVLASEPLDYRRTERIWSVATDAVVSIAPDALIVSMDFLGAALRDHAEAPPRTIDDRLSRALGRLLDLTARPGDRRDLPFDAGLARARGWGLVLAMAAVGRLDPAVEAAWRTTSRAEAWVEALEERDD